MFDSDLLIPDILNHLLGDSNRELNKSAVNFVKQHTGNQLAIQGDLSFPLLAKQWGHSVNVTEPGVPIFTHFLDNGSKSSAEDCLTELTSRLQPFIARMRIHQNRVLVFLDRCRVFASIDHVLSDGEDYGRAEEADRCAIVIHDEWEDVGDGEMLTRNVCDYRCRLVRNVLRNLIGFTRAAMRREEGSEKTVVKWLVTQKSSGGGETQDDGKRIIFCGTLRGAGQSGKKKTEITTEKYIGIRRQHMTLIAEQKYGNRMLVMPECVERSSKMGLASVVIDLLEVKHSNPATLSAEDQLNGSSKGAAFILYNSARIENLVKTYFSHIKTGHYSKPNDSALDWSLLKEEEEWQLMFNYVLEFPKVVQRCRSEDLAGNIVGPHLICSFLTGLVNVFSVYYRRVRILDHNRDHLMSRLHCRMKLILAVQLVLNQALGLLNLEPMRNM